MADGLDEDARHYVRMLVWSGFADEATALDMLADADWIDTDPAAMRPLFEAEWAAKLAAEKDWPAVTDFDRLCEAFDKLRASGFVCRHDAGFEMSDGLQEVSEGWRGARRGSGPMNYCFYHRQDVERAIDGGGLWLAFGCIEGSAKDKLAAGQAVVVALRAEGLATAWDRDAERRIGVTPFAWQNRTAVD